MEILQKTNVKTGLSTPQVDAAIKNQILGSVSKSYKSIFLEHIFTFFNIINFILAALVMYTGSYRNMLFMFIVISNIVIGLFQEVRAKRVLDKLALIHQQKASVVRDGRIAEINMDEIALNDILLLKAGDQVPVDGVVVEGECEVNESMLTGEADAIEKKLDSSIYSGCYVVAGACRIQVTEVGENTYMNSILKEVKRNKPYPSQLRDSLVEIIKLCTWILVPLGLLLFMKTYFGSDLNMNISILSTVAAVVGMIPEGLVILTSIALAVSSVKLARADVLVQELYCIETLARVDVLCLDKTGTITQGNMVVEKIIPQADWSEEQLKQLLANMFGSLEDDNATAMGIRDYVKEIPATWHSGKIFPFSSRNKCSGVVHDHHTYLAGAYSFLMEDPDPAIEEQIAEYARSGIRILAVCEGPKITSLKKGNYKLLGLILIEDEIRKDVKKTLRFFEKQGVDIKVISGDMAQTVQAIALKAGLEGNAVDMSSVSVGEIPEVVEKYTIFGRVSPEQKRDMVEALKSYGHTVAMTGDGVNDVMALKAADCSIAMGSGTQAARSIASLVLLDNQFNAMPSILNEGRRVINNIQRTASLFLVKTLYSVGLTLLTLFWLSRYPFEPIQLTLVSTLGVGIPSFVLTLEPNYKRVRGNFLANVLSRAVPGALSLTTLVAVTQIVSYMLPMSNVQFSTICTWLAGMNAMWILFQVCIPYTPLRRVLVISMTVSFVLALILLPSVFYIVILPWYFYIYILGMFWLTPAYLRLLQTMKWKRKLLKFIKVLETRKNQKA